MKSLILTIALASGAWLWGGQTAAAGDVHFARHGHRGHHHGYRHGHYHRGHHHGYHHGHHHYGHRHYGGRYGHYRGYPRYSGYSYAPYYHSPYAWQTPYYGFRLYGRNFSFSYGY